MMDDTQLDPVCGMKVSPATARFKSPHGGKQYFFCCSACLEKFRASPEKILSTPPKPMSTGLVTLGMPAPAAIAGNNSALTPLPTDAMTGAVHSAAGRPGAAGTDSRPYVCPMCPEVRRVGPGPCTKCGMALEPESAAQPTTTTEYTCPMHPEIVLSAPGACPICGMALEPRIVTVAAENPELARHDKAVLGQPRADGSAAGDCHGEHDLAAYFHWIWWRRHRPVCLDLVRESTPAYVWGDSAMA